MSLAFDVGAGPDLIGALSAPRGWAPGRRRGVAAGLLARSLSSARLLTQRLLAALDQEQATLADGPRRAAAIRDEIEIRNEFDRAAERAGLTEDEQAVLSGENRDLSRVILALETIGAALDLGLAPAAAAAWLRDEQSRGAVQSSVAAAIDGGRRTPRRRNHVAGPAGAAASRSPLRRQKLVRRARSQGLFNCAGGRERRR